MAGDLPHPLYSSQYLLREGFWLDGLTAFGESQHHIEAPSEGLRKY